MNKCIKIFFASSIIEFQKERCELGDYIRKLNNIYMKRGIYFELKLSDDFSNSIVKKGKQEEYNDEIRKSQYFYIIFGKHAGNHSIEEFNVALEQFKKTGTPIIYTYFQIFPKEIKIDETVNMFMNKLKSELHHYYSEFVHFDTVKLNIILEITRNITIGGDIVFENGTVNVNGTEMLSLEQIPFYSNNHELQRLKRCKTEKEYEFAKMLKRTEQRSANKEYGYEIESNVRERYKIHKEINNLEERIFDLYVKVDKLRSCSSLITWRQKEAIRYVDLGDYENALAVLQDNVWEEEKNEAKEKIENLEIIRDKYISIIENYISGKRLLISTIVLTGITEEVEERILSIYKQIIPDIFLYNVQLETAYEYACFLRNHNRHTQAICVLKKLIKSYDLLLENRNLADAKYMLACILYKINNIDEAIKLHLESLRIREEIKRNGDPYDILKYAQSCNQMGYLKFRLSKLDEAELYYTNAIAIQSRLESDCFIDRKKVLKEYALTLNNLAILYESKAIYDYAKKAHKKALRIRKDITQDMDDAESVGFLAMSYLNFAKFLSISEDTISETTYYFENSIKLYNNISKKDSKYLVDRAIAQYHYACFLEKRDKQKALQLHKKVLAFRYEFAIENPEALLSDLSDSYYAMGRLYYDLRDEISSKTMLDKALAIKKQLVIKAPQKYEEDYKKILRYVNESYNK